MQAIWQALSKFLKSNMFVNCTYLYLLVYRFQQKIPRNCFASIGDKLLGL